MGFVSSGVAVLLRLILSRSLCAMRSESMRSESESDLDFLGKLTGTHKPLRTVCIGIGWLSRKNSEERACFYEAKKTCPKNLERPADADAAGLSAGFGRSGERG